VTGSDGTSNSSHLVAKKEMAVSGGDVIEVVENDAPAARQESGGYDEQGRTQ
jgi:hypothetical protein